MSFLSIFFISIFTLATKGPEKNLTFTGQMKNAKQVEFLPPPNHHFNLEAPSEVYRISDKTKEVGTLDKKESVFKAQWTSENKNCEIEAQLYLCDNEKTYCVPVKRKFSCQKLSSKKNAGESEEISVSLKPNANDKKSIFILNDSKNAFENAKKQNKIVLIDFFGVWCPPCNFLDEQVFSKKQFKNFENNYVFLKMDADDPVSFELKSKYNIKGYPTIIFANSEQEEIFRIVGSRQPEAFYEEMKKALKYKGLSLTSRIAKAESLKNPEFAFDLAEMHLAKQDFQKAIHFFTLAMKNGNWTEERKNQMLSAQIGLISDPKVKSQLIESSFISFPYGAMAYERAQELVSIASELKDESLKNRAFNAQLKNAEFLLANPSYYKNSEITKPDIYSMIAEVYEHGKETEKAKENYYKAYEAYSDLIKKSKLDESKERSYNLNRIYVLYKAGRADEASELYEKLQQTYPNEFTFYFNHASQLKEMGLLEKALSKAELSYEYSYGDNKLRAVYLVADIKIKLGHKKEAKALIEETLKNFKEPEGLKVRSHRYLERLKKLL